MGWAAGRNGQPKACCYVCWCCCKPADSALCAASKELPGRPLLHSASQALPLPAGSGCRDAGLAKALDARGALLPTCCAQLRHMPGSNTSQLLCCCCRACCQTTSAAAAAAAAPLDVLAAGIPAVWIVQLHPQLAHHCMQVPAAAQPPPSSAMHACLGCAPG